MTADNHVRLTENTNENRYDIFYGDALAGFTVYRPHGDERAFVHTEIGDTYEGHGLASQLVRFAMDDMLDRGIAVLPFCPFVRSFIADHPDPYLKLVPVAVRSRFEL